MTTKTQPDNTKISKGKHTSQNNLNPRNTNQNQKIPQNYLQTDKPYKTQKETQ